MLVNKSEFTAQDVSKMYHKTYGRYIDYHEFSNYLVELNNKKLLQFLGQNDYRMCVYSWNR